MAVVARRVSGFALRVQFCGLMLYDLGWNSVRNPKRIPENSGSGDTVVTTTEGIVAVRDREFVASGFRFRASGAISRVDDLGFGPKPETNTRNFRVMGIQW